MMDSNPRKTVPPMPTYSVAILVTCHNRKEKTLSSLRSLADAFDAFNRSGASTHVTGKLFLVDDGCTDHTADAVREQFAGRNLDIILGDGQLYWAGGMRLAWTAALADSSSWDFFLLINDDTVFETSAIAELLSAHAEALKTYGKGGVYAGIISSFDRKSITYGGKVYTSRLIGKSVSLQPTGHPQPCHLTNANLLLVSREVVSRVGILPGCYRHSCADWAYGIEAGRAGFPVLVTGGVCGYCDNDHDTQFQVREKLKHMSIGGRIRYFSSPVHSTKDILSFMWRYDKAKFFLVILARTLNVLSPGLYYRLDQRR